jgi:aryl-alcohol dehydrogenase-like predicted oxidoreductase
VKTRQIGTSTVAEIGYGCMNLSHAYGIPPSAADAQRVLHRALDLGVTHFDTAALYGFGANETLLGEMLAPFRQRLYLASKCGITGVDGRRVIDGRPETLRRTLDEALRRLRTEVIDLYYLHRWDKTVPIEDSVGALASMVAAGKIRAIGLSEISAPVLRRAHAVHPVAAVQSEYSLWSRNVEVAVLEECQRIGATLVAFSPLARGFLTDSMAGPEHLLPNDIRRGMPRFQEPHWSANTRLLAPYRALAAEAGCTPAQLALAWLLQKAPHVIPIPGTTSLAHLEETMGASGIQLQPELVARLDALVNDRTISGARYPPAAQLEIDTEELQ